MNIVLEDIAKTYDKKRIFQDVNEVFGPGDSVAFTGHNGCGKSTLLKIIAGICAPSSGRIVFEGCKNPQIAYVPEKFPAVSLSARDYLDGVALIEGVDLKTANARIDSLADDFNCREHMAKKLGTLSKGTLQKIGVIQALMVESDILILDEPLSGQDVESQKTFIEKINEYRGRGKIVIMSCHEMELVRAISNKVYKFSDGHLNIVECKSDKTYTILVSGKGKKWDEMSLWGDGYKLVSSEDILSETVVRLIQDGFSLRGIYENN